MLRWDWNLEKSIATGTHNSEPLDHLERRLAAPGGEARGTIAELLLLEIPQYRRSLIRNTIAVTPFRGVGFGAVWEARTVKFLAAPGPYCTHMKASFGALLTSMIILAGCVGRLPFETPKVVEYLDGNYRTLASCTHQQLGRQHGQLRMTDLGERRAVTISPPEAQWEFSFIDDDGGRQTRLEVTSAHGTLPGEHALALARACAA